MHWLLSRLFWIDAVCINQKDREEKSAQLPLMTAIYKRASRVIVWLGPPENAQGTRIVRKLIQVLSLSKLVSNNNLFPTVFDNEEAAFIALGRLFSHLGLREFGFFKRSLLEK